MKGVRSLLPAPSRSTYFGLFFLTLSTLSYEILLTRIFSVTMWYHFAFVAISVAMFGMTVGALIVYLWPAAFPPALVHRRLAQASFVFPIVIVFSFLTELSIPFVVHPSIVAIWAIASTYAVVALPFIVSGIAVCLALTQFPRDVSRLYAVDLAGAALGCIALVYLLRVTDGPTAVFAIAAIAGLGACCFASSAEAPRLRTWSAVVTVLLAVFVVGHSVLVWNQWPVLRLIWVKGGFEARPLYEKWNSFSRVRVHGSPDALEEPYGWGLSSRLSDARRVRQLHMDIDVNAGTVLTHFDGNLAAVDYLKYDVTNFGYYVRPEASALVVGTGGGRDVLSALALGARQVVGVEINEDILHAANDRFGAFTGHLDRLPQVRFVNDEARSYIARHADRYDTIQLSLIDTWAATAAGAFVLSENALYTVEAWSIFLEHLTDRGVLMVSRWYFSDRPGEMYRLMTLAAETLRGRGVTNVRDHVVIVRNLRRYNRLESPDGVGTMLVGRSPFSDADLDRIEDTAGRLGFEVALSRRATLDDMFTRLANEPDLRGLAASFPIDISAPTDDSPFFFNMMRVRDLFRGDLYEQGRSTFNMKAVFVLGVLLATVIGLTIVCILVPLRLSAGRVNLKGAGWLLAYFGAVGMGFMLIETSQMQRLIVVLGHPTYGLSVVLFALLLSSGAGSYCAGTGGAGWSPSAGVRRLAILVVLLVIFGLATPMISRAFETATSPVRILASVGVLFVPGFFMGMAFPLGMRVAAERAPALTPWLWGVNGATSVCASVLAVVIALTASISAAFWTGTACYAIAMVAFIASGRDA